MTTTNEVYQPENRIKRRKGRPKKGEVPFMNRKEVVDICLNCKMIRCTGTCDAIRAMGGA